jgi:hypothetical protein
MAAHSPILHSYTAAGAAGTGVALGTIVGTSVLVAGLAVLVDAAVGLGTGLGVLVALATAEGVAVTLKRAVVGVPEGLAVRPHPATRRTTNRKYQLRIE